MADSQTSNAFGQHPEWRLYVRDPDKPLIGQVQAPTREEALAWARDHGWPNAVAIPVMTEYPPASRGWVERQFSLFGTVLAASSADATRRRTPYFYRKSAIAWGRMGRESWPTPSFAPLCRRIAKSYLASYHKMKGVEF